MTRWRRAKQAWVLALPELPSAPKASWEFEDALRKLTRELKACGSERCDYLYRGCLEVTRAVRPAAHTSLSPRTPLYLRWNMLFSDDENAPHTAKKEVAQRKKERTVKLDFITTLKRRTSMSMRQATVPELVHAEPTR